MFSPQLRLIISGLSFFIIFAIGFVLQHSGKPYNVALFTLHKLVSVGLVVFLVVAVIKINQVAPLSTLQIIVLAISALCFIATVATGGMLSVEKTWPLIVAVLHKVLPFATLVSTAVSLYLLS